MGNYINQTFSYTIEGFFLGFESSYTDIKTMVRQYLAPLKQNNRSGYPKRL